MCLYRWRARKDTALGGFSYEVPFSSLAIFIMLKRWADGLSFVGLGGLQGVKLS